MGYESFSNICSDVRNRYHETSARTRTAKQRKNFNAWQKRSDEKQKVHDKISDLTDRIVQAELSGNRALAAKLKKQRMAIANVPSTREELLADAKQDRKDRELFLAGVAGYSEEEASDVYDRIVDCEEMHNTRKQIEKSTANFLKRVRGY